MPTNQNENETVPTPDESALNDLGRLFLAEIQKQAADYNSRVATLSAATGDKQKAVHDLRENSDDAKVVKFRKWLEDLDAKREQAISEIDAYISEKLLSTVSLSEEEVAAEREALKALKAEINGMRKTFLDLPAVRDVENVEALLPKLEGSRASSSRGGGSGGAKPRIAGIYVDGEICQHEVENKTTGEVSTKSSFTDAVKYLSDLHKVKVNTSDLHSAWFAAAGVTAENWSDAPNETEFVFTVTDKDGKTHNHTVLITMPTE